MIHESKKQPIRTCLGCRERSGKSSFVRIVKNKEGSVLVDESGRLPGRGAYICLTDECINKGLKKKVIDKALKTNISVSVLDEFKKEILKLK